jgi:glycosyltransferase involved in cell wall biosynthesis
VNQRVRRLILVTPAGLTDPAAATGGNRYDQALAAALGELGVEVEMRPAEGQWPVAGAYERDQLARLLQGSDPVLVDGLVACGAPHAVSSAAGAGSKVHVLVHLPLALETGLNPRTAATLAALERQALHAAAGVLATSEWAAADLCVRHELDTVAVAAPGTDPAPPSTGSTPPRILQLASITPRKDQLTVLEALSFVQDLSWTADLTGSLDADPDYAAQVRAAIERHQLADRVALTGPVTGSDLESIWQRTDLLLLASHAETWGMAVTEALAHGIPAVVGDGTGAREALGSTDDGVPGAVVPPGDPTALAAAIRDLLGPGKERVRPACLARRKTLRSWQDTAQDVLAALA